MKKSIKHLLMALLLVFVFTFSGCTITNPNSNSQNQNPSGSENTETYYTVSTDGYIQKVKEGEKAIEPDLEERENFDFIGWFEGDNLFSFDSVITRDYTIVSRWQEKEENLSTAEGITTLSGKMLTDGENLVSGEDYTIGVLNNVSLLNGEFTVAFSGKGNHGVYFRLGATEVYRGRPDGNYYALNVDAYGNITLEKGIDGSIQVLALSLELKGDYSSQNTYTFTVQLLDKMIRVFHGTKLILTYTDSALPFGNEIVLYGESANSEFVVGNIKADTGCECKDNLVIWSDKEVASGYKIVVGNIVQNLSGKINKFDLASLDLQAGIHKVQVIRVTGSGETLIGEVEYIVEGIPTDITVYSGEVVLHGQDYYTKQSKSLAILKDTELLNGKISTMMTPNTPNDCGLVFRCSYGNLTNFWEDRGVCYYTALINSGGGLLLGKVNSGTAVWTTLASVTIAGFNASNTYLLEVGLNYGNICVSVNGTKLIDYTDNNYFTGTAVGFRSAAAGVKTTPITIEQNKVESIVLTAPKAVKLNTQPNLLVQLKYNNGYLETLSSKDYTVTGLDTSSVGTKNIKVSYQTQIDGVSKTLTASMPIIVADYYVADFTSVNSATGLPIGWVHSCEGGTGEWASVSTTSAGIKVNTNNVWCNVMQYTGADFTATDYTVEMSVKVISASDINRWCGITVRGTEANGYYRTYLVMDGRTGGSTQANFTLGNGVKVNNANSSSGTKLSGVTYGDTVDFKVTVSGLNLYYYVNGTLVNKVTLPSGYSSGVFGFTFGGGEYLIDSIAVRSVLQSDIVNA